MAIITKPALISKNSAASITLNKANLALVPSVAADAYFSDSANWKDVAIHYMSSIGDQKEILIFDATLASPSAEFLVSDKARDEFVVKKIVIGDFDGGSISITAEELNPVEFDITLGGSPVVGSAIAWQSRPDYTPEIDGGATSTNVGYPGIDSIMFAQTPIDTSVDFTITYNIDITVWAAYVFIGYCNQSQLIYSGFYKDTNFSSILINNSAGLLGAPLPNSGLAELKIEKVGSNLAFKINGTTIHTASSSVLDSFIYPAVRLMENNVTITSSSIA